MSFLADQLKRANGYRVVFTLVVASILSTFIAGNGRCDPRPSKVFIYEARFTGYVIPSGQEEAYERDFIKILQDQLARLYPCANFESNMQLGDTIRRHRARFLRGEVGVPPIEEAFNLSQDYLVIASLSRLGKSAVLVVKIFSLKRRSVSVHGLHTVEGVDPASDPRVVLRRAIVELLPKLYLEAICPWRGKIVYRARHKLDSSWSQSSGGATGVAEDFRKLNNRTSEWQIEKIGLTNAKGKVETSVHEFFSHKKVETGDLTCFKRLPNGDLNGDDRYSTKRILDVHTELNSVGGSTNFENTKVQVQFTNSNGEYTLSIPSIQVRTQDMRWETHDKHETECESITKDSSGTGINADACSILTDEQKGSVLDKSLHGQAEWRDGHYEYKLTWDLKKD
jgi:hypothetical protein